jgi:multidrug resistance efflux pump
MLRRTASAACLSALVALAAGALMSHQALAADGVVRPRDPRLAEPVRGLVRPLARSAIATDLPFRVVELNVREAQPFKEGDVLVVFDCERLQAEFEAADAMRREMQLTLQSNLYLDKNGAAGALEVGIAQARADKAKAEAQSLAARLKQCKIVAPFSGRVVELTINLHEMPASGKPFMVLVDESRFELDLVMPSLLLKGLRPEHPFTFTIDETGRSYKSRIDRVGAAVDPVSQSIKLIAVIDARAPDIVTGMSGWARFDTGGGP